MKMEINGKEDWVEFNKNCLAERLLIVYFSNKWPEVVIEKEKDDEVIHFIKNFLAKEFIDKDGVTEELEDCLISCYLEENKVQIVTQVDNKEHQEIVAEIKNIFQGTNDETV